MMPRTWRGILRTMLLMMLWLISMAGVAWAQNCQLRRPAPLAFGVYDTLAPVATTAATSFTVRCLHKVETPAMVEVLITAGTSGQFSERSMISASGGVLVYNLFADAGNTVVVGDGSGGSSSLFMLVDRTAPWEITLFGSIPPRQNVPADTYSDALTLSILY